MKLSMLPGVLALVFLSFSENKLTSSKALNAPVVTVPLNPEKAVITVDSTPLVLPVLGKGYTGFKTAIGFKESQGDYNSVNAFGYLGKYQFSQGTLALIGVFDVNKFMNNPEMQEAAFYAYVARNKWLLRDYIDRYAGETIDGVKITASGIVAAAHLAGSGGVKRYLNSGGESGAVDAFGTSIKHYMEWFGGYDLSSIKPNRVPRVEEVLVRWG